MTKKPVTLIQVAAKAGVSVMTASRALTDEGSASDLTRAKVRAAAQELGYTPNALARKMKGGRTQVIGVIVNDLRSVVLNSIVTDLSEEVRKFGMDLFIYNSLGVLDADKGTRVNELLSGLWDGLLFVMPQMSDSYLQMLEKSASPILLINYCRRETSLPVVKGNNVNGAFDAVTHLIELGHRRIAFVRGTAHSGQSDERERGYRSALEQAGIEFDPELVQQGDFNEASGLAAGRALLALANRPTAVFAANDSMALGCLSAAREKDLKVPQDLSLIGFDDIAMAAAVQPGLTTLRQPVSLIAHAAVHQLMLRIEDKPGRRHRIEFPTEFIIRESTGPVADAAPARRRARKGA